MKSRLKIALISAIIFIFYIILHPFVRDFFVTRNFGTSRIISFFYLIFVTVIPWILFVLYSQGISSLGRKYKNLLLRIPAILLIIYSIIALFPEISYALYKLLFLDMSVSQLTSKSPLLYFTFSFFAVIGTLVNWISPLVLGILFVIMGIGLIILKDEIKYSTAAGGLSIILGAINLILFIIIRLFAPSSESQLASFLSNTIVMRALDIIQITFFAFGALVLFFELKKDKTKKYYSK